MARAEAVKIETVRVGQRLVKREGDYLTFVNSIMVVGYEVRELKDALALVGLRLIDERHKEISDAS